MTLFITQLVTYIAMCVKQSGGGEHLGRAATHCDIQDTISLVREQYVAGDRSSQN